jgi:hypothetical protein
MDIASLPGYLEDYSIQPGEGILKFAFYMNNVTASGTVRVYGITVGTVKTLPVTWDPDDKDGTLYNDNMSITVTNGASSTVTKSTGKWYYEVQVEDNSAGIASLNIGVTTKASANTWAMPLAYVSSGQVTINAVHATQVYGTAYGKGDIIGVALDVDNKRAKFYKNGVPQGDYVSYSTTDPVCPGVGRGTSVFNATINAGFSTFSIEDNNPSGWAELYDSGFRPYCWDM